LKKRWGEVLPIEMVASRFEIVRESGRRWPGRRFVRWGGVRYRCLVEKTARVVAKRIGGGVNLLVL
jgi:hypothetical protein